VRIYLIVFLAIILFTIHEARAGDWNATVLLASSHPFSDTFECNGVDRDYNESNPGLIIGYKNFILGRYENSESGCGDIEYSNLIGADANLGELGPVQFSVTAGLSDGYQDEGGSFGEYKAWASVNAQLGPVKIYYGYRVIALGLTFNFGD
jgi:hypothetical protein